MVNYILLIHEHGISSHLFMSSISFINILRIFQKEFSFTSLGNFISRYFILFDAMINGIVSLISFSDSQLFAYRNATDFCLLILYPATLLNSFDSFTSSFPIWILFISFSCLIWFQSFYFSRTLYSFILDFVKNYHFYDHLLSFSIVVQKVKCVSLEFPLWLSG